MAELADALDLGSSGETHQSSSLCVPKIKPLFDEGFSVFTVALTTDDLTTKRFSDASYGSRKTVHENDAVRQTAHATAHSGSSGSSGFVPQCRSLLSKIYPKKGLPNQGHLRAHAGGSDSLGVSSRRSQMDPAIGVRRVIFVLPELAPSPTGRHPAPPVQVPQPRLV